MKRYLKPVLFTLAGAWLLAQAYHYYRISFPSRTHAMITELQDMQTFCIGRYQIDLPRGTTVIRSEIFREGITFYEEGPIAEDKYRHLVDQRWKELQQLTGDTSLGSFKPYTLPSQKIELSQDGIIFTSRHRDVYADWPNEGKKTEHFYDTEGYLYQKGNYFLFEANTELELMKKVITQLQSRDQDILPTTSGFCSQYTFFPGSVPSFGEGANIAYKLPGSGAELRIKYPTSPSPGPRIDSFNDDTFKAHIMRQASLSVNGMSGTEQVASATEKRYESFDHGIDARWYFPGPVPGYENLGIRIVFEYSKDTQDPAPIFGRFPPRTGEHDLDEEKFLTLWDSIMPTLKLRPNAL